MIMVWKHEDPTLIENWGSSVSCGSKFRGKRALYRFAAEEWLSARNERSTFSG